jgi:hypothetical protein
MVPNGYNTIPFSRYFEEIAGGINTIGSVYFVDVNAGADTNDGLSWETAYKTLAVALAASHADIAANSTGWANRNRIFYKGDNNEVTAETLVKLADKTDIIGVGSYDHRPFPVLIGNHVIAGSYMGCRFINMGFKSLAAGGVIMTLVTAQSGIEFIGCEFDGSTATPATIGLLATAVEKLKVSGCRFIGKFSTTAIDIGAGESNGLMIENNIIQSGAIGIRISSTFTCSVRDAWIIKNLFDVTTLVVDENSDKVIIGGNRGVTAAAQTLALIFDYNSALACDNIITSATVTSVYPALGAIA